MTAHTKKVLLREVKINCVLTLLYFLLFTCTFDGIYQSHGDQMYINQGYAVCAVFGADWATYMASSWMENPTDKDKLLLKHQMRPPCPVKG